MLTINELKQMNSCVRLSDGTIASDNEICMEKEWTHDLLTTRVVNRSDRSVRIKEVVLFSGELHVLPETPFYGEGYMMLCQYAGTLSEPYVVGAYGTDWDFFRLPKTKYNEHLWTVYNMLLLSPANDGHVLLAFTSCNRFSGEFRFKDSYLEVIMDTEDLSLEAGQSWDLESFLFSGGTDRNQLLEELGENLNRNHPRMLYPEIPTGWCSYYCLRPLTAEGLYDNARAMAQRIPELGRIQIDGGYASRDGDHLLPSTRLGADVRTISESIRAIGVEAAGYLSPFIVHEEAQLFKEHPDWLVRDEEGNPFNEIGRKRDWYMLDGSNPEAQNYLRTAVRVMHDEWGWRYFKLDFLAYGALPGGCRYDKNATRVEAFRSGIKAIVDEVGHDSFILGCNAPFWPILGLIHGNRVTNDIFRDWKHVSGNARELFGRNWQNNTLWFNDPDVIVLEKLDLASWTKDGEAVIKKSTLTDDEFEFHKAFIVASGGMILNGDLLTSMSEENIKTLKKLLPPTGAAAVFEDTSYDIGRIDLGDRHVICLFNWEEQPRDYEVALNGGCRLYDFWTEEEIGFYQDHFELHQLAPHSAKVLYYKL